MIEREIAVEVERPVDAVIADPRRHQQRLDAERFAAQPVLDGQVDVDRDVEIAVGQRSDQIAAPKGGRYQADVRCLRKHARRERWKARHLARQPDSDTKLARRLCGIEAPRPVERRDQFAQRRMDRFGDRPCSPGGDEAIALTDEQGIVQHRAQLGQRMADRGLRQIEVRRGGRHAALGIDGVEYLEQVEVEPRQALHIMFLSPLPRQRQAVRPVPAPCGRNRPNPTAPPAVRRRAGGSNSFPIRRRAARPAAGAYRAEDHIPR